MFQLNDVKQMVLGIDPGAGGIKVHTGGSGAQIPSQVAADGSRIAGSGGVVGLVDANPPTHVQTNAGEFWVGPGAHRWGRPLEGLDHSRFRGSPGMAALLYAALEQHVIEHGAEFERIEKAYVGIPQEAVSIPGLIEDVKAWLIGAHTWRVDDGPERTLELRDVQVTSQPAAAFFDYLLDEDGNYHQDRKRNYSEEVGIISIGMSTIEMLAVQNGKPIPRFTHAENAGVRRLLQLLDPRGHYSRGELDERLRGAGFDKDELIYARNIWGGEVIGLIEEYWEGGRQTWERFGVIINVGGGVHQLRHPLARKFAGKVHIPDDPVMAIARGLWKMALRKEIPLAKRRARRE